MKLFALVVALIGGLAAALVLWTRSESLTTVMWSRDFNNVIEKETFFRRYLTNDRLIYTEADYFISYHDGSGLLPSPTEYDILVIAKVPEAAVPEWLPSPAAPMNAAKTARYVQRFKKVQDRLTIPGDVPDVFLSNDHRKVAVFYPASSIICCHWSTSNIDLYE